MTSIVVACLIAIAAAPAVAGVEDDVHEADKAFDQGDWKQAAAAYDRGIAKAPQQVSVEAYGKRAAIFILQKDYKGGLDFVAKAKTHYPNAAEIMEQESLLLWGVDKRDDAIAVAEKLVKVKPQSYANQQIIGEYYSTRDPVKTAAAFEAYLAHRPTELEQNDVLPRVRLGFAYLASARTTLADGDELHSQQLYTKAVDQFEYIQRKLGKRPNAQSNSDNGLCAAYSGLSKWDQAIAVCERIVQNPKLIDATGSVWFNLATAYLAKQQPKKARTAATEFTKVRKGEIRGLMLVGDTYFAENDWTNALDQYTRAEKLLKPNQPRDTIQLSIRLGKTYRRLPPPATGPNPNLDHAIAKLSAAFTANPSSLELATELGIAYVEAKQDVKATQLADRLIAGPDLAKATPDQHAAVLVLAGKSLFNQHKLKEARQRFEAAMAVKSTDLQIQHELIATINEQAFELAKDPKSAQAMLDQALALDPVSPTTLTNIAVLAIDHGDCDSALHALLKLKDAHGNDPVIAARLLGRAYLCAAKPDPKKAAESFALAEKEAKKSGEQLALAEIYTEWAPLIWDTDLNGAIDKLEVANQVAAQDPEIGPALKRNLAIALYRRGWRSMHDGKSTEAAADFERATRDPSVLRGTEPLAFDFSYAIALLDANRTSDAAKLFKGLSAKGNQATYLKGPYAKVGSQFFASYSTYRNASGPQRAQACGDLAKLEADIGGKAKELISSCWEMVALDEFRSGSVPGAQKALSTAEKSATPDQKRRITLDRAAIALDKNKLDELEGLGGNPPEALVDLGILYETLGKPKEAYDAWQRAKARGVNVRDLQKWIDAKKRLYGF